MALTNEQWKAAAQEIAEACYTYDYCVANNMEKEADHCLTEKLAMEKMLYAITGSWFDCYRDKYLEIYYSYEIPNGYVPYYITDEYETNLYPPVKVFVETIEHRRAKKKDIL